MIYFSLLYIKEGDLRLAKWGNSLAIRLPKQLIDDLELKEGDEIELIRAGEHRFAVERRDRAAEFLRSMQEFRFPLPADYKFDRDDANRR